VAFGSTRRKDLKPEEDPILNSLLSVDVKVLVIFGKAWDLHVEKVLNTTLEENLNMIQDTIKYLISKGKEVIFDAEHFFDGFKANPSYALEVVKVAYDAGAKLVTLCDTNGGSLTWQVEEAIKRLKDYVKCPLGIHTHNDSGLAVANTLVAVKEGITHVQGTINGLGERCGNADLCQILPALIFKMKKKCLISSKPEEEQLKNLTELSRYIYELANIRPIPSQPYVGKNAFRHKGGVHIDAMLKESRAYEHINPTLVGNDRDLIVSELSGKAGILKLAEDIGLKLNKDTLSSVIKKVKDLEALGFQFEDAKASVQLMILRSLKDYQEPFNLKYWKVLVERGEYERIEGEVSVDVNGESYHEKAEGKGPVHALDKALRRVLLRKFPELKDVNLVNYKVTVVDSSVYGTASLVRVFAEFYDGKMNWATCYASQNIIEASAKAISDGYIYWLNLKRISKY